MSRCQNNYRRHTAWISLLALFLVLGIGGCKSNDSTKEDAAQEKTDTKKVEKSQKDDEQAADAPPADIYPGMKLGVLDGSERTKFVEIAKAEVCPCPDAAESLHVCLQDQAKSCNLAMQVAGTMARGVKAGASKTDILDVVAKFVENAQKTHAFDLKDVPAKGNKDAPVTLVEFADFQCPHCKVASGILDTISKKYGDKVVIYFKQFPLNAHGQSSNAAVAALAAHNQDKFWQMHDLLFENQRTLTDDSYERFAGRIGLNLSKFKTDLKSPMIAGAISRDRKEGEQAGLTGTPTIYINGHQYQGAIDQAAITAAIDAELKALEAADEKPADEKPADDKPDDE